MNADPFRGFLLASAVICSVSAAVAAPGNSNSGGNNGKGTTPGHSNGIGGGNGGVGHFFSGGGGNSGGAPSPEVNAGLGVLLAGATVAFLRRKRGSARKVITA